MALFVSFPLILRTFLCDSDHDLELLGEEAFFSLVQFPDVVSNFNPSAHNSR